MSAVIQYETHQVSSECKVNTTQYRKSMDVFSLIYDLQKATYWVQYTSLNEKAMYVLTITKP